jgi:inorganic pyrophosphatase
MKLTSLVELASMEPESDLIRAVVETPKGSRNRYKYDEKLGVFALHKALPLGASFPYDFGFIPSTRGEDGDPLDILVLMDEPSFPACVVPARLIGVIEANQTAEGKTERNDRLIALLETPYNRPECHSLEELPESRLAELEHFFISYNHMEGREFKPIGRRGPRQAMEQVQKGMRRFRNE